MDQISVVGGGIAGLVAAIECAESGVSTRVLEARGHLGGRGTSTGGEYVTGLGPHAFYRGGSMWDWLVSRQLEQPYRRPALTGLRFRWQSRILRVPPLVVATGAKLLFRRDAPVDEPLRDWVCRHASSDVADAMAGAAGVVTFDHDPGRLSAKFVAERIKRILLSVPPPARYVTGGWVSVIDRMSEYAKSIGVQIETHAKVDDIDALLSDGPVIVAVAPRSARRLLDDPSLTVESPRVALLDIGLKTRRKDPYIVSDLDEAAFVDRFTAVDPTLAPDGHELVQASLGMRPQEPLDEAVKRIEDILDAAFVDWRARLTWRRQSAVSEATGALDMPGTTYRDRPAIEHSSGAFLAGDWVAAPGHLSEVSCASGQRAAQLAVAQLSAGK